MQEMERRLRERDRESMCVCGWCVWICGCTLAVQHADGPCLEPDVVLKNPAFMATRHCRLCAVSETGARLSLVVFVQPPSGVYTDSVAACVREGSQQQTGYST
jgi:hypothetical protein